MQENFDGVVIPRVSCCVFEGPQLFRIFRDPIKIQNELRSHRDYRGKGPSTIIRRPVGLTFC